MAQPQKITFFPPTRVHSVKPLSASETQPLLATYLEKSRKKPCLHPDAWLRPEGVRHGFKGGPSGGFVMHHLRRIEAGLRGESLQPETTQELVQKFGEEAVMEATGLSLGDVQAAVDFGVDPTSNTGEEDERPVGDDTRVDKVIKEGENDKERRKREKKERRQRDKVAQEQEERQAKAGAPAAASSASDEGKPAVEDAVVEKAAEDAGHEKASKKEQKQKKEKAKAAGDDTKLDKVTKGVEAEKASKKKEKEEEPKHAEEEKASKSKQNQERKQAAKRKRDEQEAASAAPTGALSSSKSSKKKRKLSEPNPEEWLSKEDYEQSQPILEGEVGERDGAPVVRQDGKPPVVVTHDEQGNVEVPKRPLTEAEKAARKAAKKARRSQGLDA